MATSQFTEFPVVPANRNFAWSWGGIFSGTFVYIMIETTFGLLGAAIFSTASNPNAGVPTSPAASTGFQVWMVILSIIALYFAGKTSSKLLYGAADRNLGMYHGLVTFGMSIFTTVLIIALASAGTTVYTVNAGAMVPVQPVTIGSYIGAGGEWWLFVAFFLAMIAAAAGGIHGVRTAATPVDRTVITKRVA
jgi:hypothetical protein